MLGLRAGAPFAATPSQPAFCARVRQEWPGVVGTTILPAPIYTVGSWNEEYEGHAVLPAQFNLALRDSEQGGFDIGMALKQVFGWNHYAKRAILGS